MCPVPVPEPIPSPVPEPIPSPVPEPIPSPVPSPVPAPIPQTRSRARITVFSLTFITQHAKSRDCWTSQRWKIDFI